MKMDFSKVLTGMEGNELKLERDEKTVPLTLGTACIMALRLNAPDDKFDGQEKLTRYMLGTRIAQAKEPLDLTIEEIAKLKELAGKYLSVEVSGAVWLALEGKDT